MAKYVVRPHRRTSTLLDPDQHRARGCGEAAPCADSPQSRCGEGSGSWTDAEIAVALDASESTVHRVRQAFVEQGWEAALARQRPTGRRCRKLDGAQEAQLIALACSAPPTAARGGH